MAVLDFLQNIGGNQPVATPQGYTDPVADMNILAKIGLGLGGVGAVNAYRESGLRLQEKQMEERKNQALKELAERMQRGEISPEEARMEYVGISGDYDSMFGAGSKKPALLQIAEAYQGGDENYRNILETFGKVYDKGVQSTPDGAIVPREGYGQALGTLARDEKYGGETGKLQAQGQLQPQIEYDTTMAGEMAKQQAEREGGIGQLEQQADYMLKTIDKALEDEAGLEASVGGFFGLTGRQSSMLPLSADQRRFQPIVDQLKGQTFLEAYERLKGGGVITEIEGAKAESAIARLNQAQDPDDFANALLELKDVVTSGLERAKANTSGGGGNANMPSTPTAGGGSQPKVVKFGDLQ